MSRAETPRAAPEKQTLGAFLDRYRATMLDKLAGLDREQLTRRLVPSATTLLGMLKHLADVERWWYRRVFAGEPVPPLWGDEEEGSEFVIGDDDTLENVTAAYREEITHADAIIAAAELDDVSVAHRPGISLRWIMIHMIEETARHCGHADILREQIDGKTGY